MARDQAVTRAGEAGSGRMGRRMRAACLAAAAFAAFDAARPAGLARADWLVLRDGSRIETAGPFTIKGKLVVFTPVKGALSSLRWDSVDEKATAEANRPASEPGAGAAAAAKAVPPPPVLVLREEDLAKARPLPATEETSAGGPPATSEAASETASEARAKQVVIVDWERATINDGADSEIVGTLRNDTGETAIVRGVRISVFDAQGRLIASADGTPRSQQVPPGQTTSFRATLTGVASFAAARFRVEASAAPGGGDS